MPTRAAVALTAAAILLAPPTRGEAPAGGLGGAGEPCGLEGIDRARATVEQCLACHDGARAPRVDAHQSHPLGVDYEEAVSAQRGGSPLRPAAEALARGVVLPDGRIGCTSCHDGASAMPARLAGYPPVRPPQEGADAAGAIHVERVAFVPAKALCLACHALD